jgi:FkbM family methyltransferase
MSFISYAQNFEDVMLWRALKHIETGFYIDVGANDPETDSVTKAFYDLGWRGINIEPVSQWFLRLQETRVRDINLQLALGSEPGEITLYEIPDTGLSTAQKAFADRHAAERGYQNRELKVTQDTLANICEHYHIAPIHFLKIDVEGMEKAVLEGADFGKIRPWIVLVESNLPNSQKESHGEWEPIILNAGYQHAYSDGINRFYVADEHSELSGAFQYPPNVFDDFVIRKHLETEARATDAETHAQEVESELAKFRANTIEYQNQLEHSAVRVERLKEELKASEKRASEAELQADASETEKRETKRRLEEAESELATIGANLTRYQHELEDSATQIKQLEHKLNEKSQELASNMSELQQQQDRSQWLQNEWNAAEAKNKELNQSIHNWWAVADGLNRELASIYQSKFWRLTWPLRKAMQGLKGVLQFLAGLIQLPRKVARWFLAKTIGYTLRHERLTYRARQYLYRYPKLEAHFRAFARSQGLIPGFMPPPQDHDESIVIAKDERENAHLNSGDLTNNAEQLHTLTPRARRFYKNLKSAIEKRHGSTD